MTTSSLGRSGLILASLVLAAAITLPRAAFPSPAGVVGPSPALTPLGGKDPQITFSFNIGGYIGSGTLTATNMGGGLYRATGGTLTMSSTSTGGYYNSSNSAFCLVAVTAGTPQGTPPYPYYLSPLNLFFYDDVLQPGANPVIPDVYGLQFANTAAECGESFSGSDEINIYAEPTATGIVAPNQYSFADGQNQDGVRVFPILYNTPAGAIDSFNASIVSTTYSYSGNAFNLFECATSPNPDCSTPGTGNPYGTANSVTAALQLSAPLCSTGPGTCSTLPINVICSANFLSLTLNDGINTISANTPCTPGTPAAAGATAWVMTDVNGNITAWYLDASGAVSGGSGDIHTLYDPSGSIYAACNGCYGSDDAKGEDKGSITEGDPTYYGYILNSPGTFIPPGQGGATTAGNCTAASPCQLSPIASTIVTVAPGVTFPTNDPIVEASYYIASDPRGPNCGYNGPKGQPTPLVLSSVQVSTGPGAPPMSGSFLGAEIIPWNVCIPPGGAWVDYAIDEQLATINGLDAYPSFVAPQGSSFVSLSCPPPGGQTPVNGYASNQGNPYQLIVSGTRKASHTEEQHPEGTLIPAIAACDNGKGSGVPSRSVTLFNVQFIQPNPQAKNPIPGTANNQQILLTETAAEYGYLSLALMPLINFQPAQVGKTLEACYIQAELQIAKGNYNCAAYQTYKCDQILKSTPVAEVGPSFSILRLPDPWGDLHSRNLTLGFLLNMAAGNPPDSLDDPNIVSEIPNWASCPAK